MIKITSQNSNKKISVSNVLLILFFLLFTKNYAQVGVNILSPHSSAAMQIESPAGTAKGLLTPTMTTVQRLSITTGTNVAADGLVVYDIDHHMHYYFQGAVSKWVSMSPLTLSAVGASTTPSGVITTPSSPATFSLGINTQNPSQALDVVGNISASGNISAGGNISTGGSITVASHAKVTGNATVTGNAAIAGTLTVTGFASNALVPTGVIVMWSGTVIPIGWGLCDGGTYGGLLTPDLRGRFVVGVDHYTNTQIIATGEYIVIGQTGLTPLTAPNDGTTINYGTIGNKGGENGHTLSMAEMPQHNHAVTLNNAGFAVTTNGYTTGGGGGLTELQNQLSITEQNRGNSVVHENRPPYYVLAYIIKLP